MQISREQIIRVQSAMSSRANSREERLDIISELVGREVNSTKDLTTIEADELLYFLNVGKVKQDNWGMFDKHNVKHKILLSQLYTANWVKEHPVHGEVPDTERLSNFLKGPKSPVQKPLLKMTPKEVEKVIKAFKGIINSTYK